MIVVISSGSKDTLMRRAVVFRIEIYDMNENLVLTLEASDEKHTVKTDPSHYAAIRKPVSTSIPQIRRDFSTRFTNGQRYLDAAGRKYDQPTHYARKIMLMADIYDDSTLDKLIGYCMGRESVTADDISAVCSPQLKDRVFEMITAVSRRQKQKALSIYMDLIALRTPAQVILTLLQREYSRLLQIRELRKAGEPGEEIAKRTGLSAWIIKKNYMPVIGKMDAGRLEQSLQYCLQADQDYKSGKIDAGIAVEMTIIRLCG